MPTKQHCQVVLNNEGMKEMEFTLQPFFEKGARDTYISAKKLDQIGSFLVITTEKQDIDLWIPVHYVRCAGFSELQDNLGF
jgi:hypothetical protein